MVWGYCMGKIPVISHQPVSKTSCGAGGGWGLPDPAGQPVEGCAFRACEASCAASRRCSLASALRSLMKVEWEASSRCSRQHLGLR